MAKLFNLARMSTATTGTGTLTLGAPISGFLSFAAAGAVDGDTLAYAISDGANSEIGTGVYTAAGTTLTRVVTTSTNSNTAISLSGSAQVFITPRSADLLNPANNLSDVVAVATARTNLGLGTAALRADTDYARSDTVQSLTATQQKQIRSNAGVNDINLVINGDFRVNQRVYGSGGTLASGAYGHDRWKGGAAGGDYSFVQAASSTLISVAANKTLIQVIEDKNVIGGSYVLSWTGSCQARVGLNSATPSGSYANSPVLITGQTAGTTMSVEFGNGAAAGTLNSVKLEPGAAATPFIMRSFLEELALCKRYYRKSYAYATAPGGAVSAAGVEIYLPTAGTGIFYHPIRFDDVEMFTTPTVTLYDLAGTSGTVTKGANGKTAAVLDGSAKGFVGGTNDATSSANLFFHYTASAEL